MITRYGMSEEFDMVGDGTGDANQYLGGDAQLACSPADGRARSMRRPSSW